MKQLNNNVRIYDNESNAKRACTQFKRHNKEVIIFKHNRNDKRYKQQIAYAVYLK